MRTSAILSIIIFSVVLAGCSKDAEVNAFITEFDSATNEIVVKVNANPTSAGIEEAQKAFDARKPELKAKWDGIKDAVGVQISSDTKKRLESSLANNMKALTEVSIRNMIKMAADKNASAKFRRLMEDYSQTFAVPAKSS